MHIEIRNKEGVHSVGILRPLLPADYAKIRRQPLFFDNWLQWIRQGEAYGLLARNHRLLSVMALRKEKGIMFLEQLERVGWEEGKKGSYRTAAYMIAYACWLNKQENKDAGLIIVPKTTPNVLTLYRRILDIGEYEEAQVRPDLYIIRVSPDCGEKLIDLYLKEEG